MPVDPCAPLLVVLALIVAPVAAAVRGPRAFAAAMAAEAAFFAWLWPRLLSGGGAEFLFVFWAAVLTVLPPLAGGAILFLRGGRAAGRAGGSPRCPSCGYDLTANTSGTCPECGTPVAKGAKP